MQVQTIDNQQVDEPGGATDQYLTFLLGDEEFGVDILRVQEIKGWEQATAIPNTPDYIRGVMNLRGTVVPIVDLRRRFQLDSAEYTPTTVVIVLKVEGDHSTRTMGFVVDAVSDVYNVAPENLQPAPDFGSRVNTQFIRGLAVVEEKMVILLDFDSLIGLDTVFSAANGLTDPSNQNNPTSPQRTE
jgi:purine-binding chemotaxis protein CheW